MDRMMSGKQTGAFSRRTTREVEEGMHENFNRMEGITTEMDEYKRVHLEQHLDLEKKLLVHYNESMLRENNYMLSQMLPILMLLDRFCHSFFFRFLNVFGHWYDINKDGDVIIDATSDDFLGLLIDTEFNLTKFIRRTVDKRIYFNQDPEYFSNI